LGTLTRWSDFPTFAAEGGGDRTKLIEAFFFSIKEVNNRWHFGPIFKEIHRFPMKCPQVVLFDGNDDFNARRFVGRNP
jgi:hypothetical protein